MSETGRDRHASYRNSEELGIQLSAIGREFHARGWVLGTSGNFSAVASGQPLRLAVTVSGVDKGTLTPEQFLLVDELGAVVDGKGQPSAELSLHLSVVKARGARAVLHTHSVWGTILSEAYAHDRGIGFKGLEMLKGLDGVTTHEHREWLPILENSQNYGDLASALDRLLEQYPGMHGFLLRGHGLYTWGNDLSSAKRHVEILEFLMEVTGRSRSIQ
jgi:methylthioribulose-1-phosphate dehydratase